MKTRVWRRRPRRRASRRSQRNCSTISPLVRERSTPDLVEAQKSQVGEVGGHQDAFDRELGAVDGEGAPLLLEADE
jgi:hypothetical protein